MKTRFLAALLLWMLVVAAHANDGVFYVNGSHLIPLKETDIAVTKEVLTLTLDDSEYAQVDVQYEFTNRGGAAKTVSVGFEAQAPYNDYEYPFDPSGRHPFIRDFTVTMNGARLAYKTAVVKSGSSDDPSDFVPLDLKVWRVPTGQDPEFWGNNLMRAGAGEDDYITFSCAYYFTATFQPGKNTVRHTYRYRMSNGVGRTFELPYWLLPAVRWANGRIDDFTLRIKVPATAKHFVLPANVFEGATFKVTQGRGKIRTVTAAYSDEPYQEMVVSKGAVEWHKLNFRPKADFTLSSADAILDMAVPVGTFYDRSEGYIPKWGEDMTAAERRIVRNLPYASRGYVFKDQQLQAYFNKLFWYMPDAGWKQDTSDFTKHEWQLINQNK